VSLEWVRRQREEGREWRGEIERKDVEVQQQERFERIQRSRWNEWYKNIRVLGVPRYLKERGKERRMVRVARFRLGSEMRGGRYWEQEEKRKCRICGWAEETWEHMMEVCMREEEEGGRDKILEILEDDGRGEGWMKRLQKRREEGRGKGEGKATGNGQTMDEYEREREEE